MKEKYIKQKDRETLSDFELGQIDILRWLETTFQKEKSELETKRAEEIYNSNTDEFMMSRTRLATINMYLYNIKATIKAIKGEKNA